MKSTLYLKFIIIYMIFGFMSLFTVATLTRTLTEEPLERDLAADVYQEANLVANEYLPHYFLGQIDESAVHTQLVGMEAHLDGAVWFVDREGNMITSAHSDGYPTAPTAIEDFNPAEIGSAKYEVGTYHDYFKEDMITVIAPVVHGYSTQGYLLIHKKHDSDWTITDYVNECSVYHTCSHLSVVIFHFAWNSVYRVQTALQDNRGSETICVR